MTDVHYKIRYTKYANKRFDEFVKLSDPPFGYSRAEQILDYCVDHNIDPSTVIILETSREKLRLSLLEFLRRGK